MLVGIRFKPEQMVKQEDGLLVLRLGRRELGPGPWLVSVKGETADDWDSEENPAMSGGYLIVGQRGGLQVRV